MNQTMKKIKRQERILCTLNNLTYTTIIQLQTIEKLGSYRNAHRILHEMEKDKLISSVRYDKKIYYLSNRGKERIGSYTKLKKSFMTHALMRNDLYIKLGMPSDWKKEQGIVLNEERIIPDATFKRNGEYFFVEIDNTQTMRTNIDKIKKYKELSKAIFNQYQHTPTLLWYSLSERRKERLKEACVKSGIKFQIY